ncbi:MAG TPA: hypothetical protein VMZ03_13505 [Chitinophagaceae bacterium]|nr:hypothetical protein [Chitinophagaceae bacterium]
MFSLTGNSRRIIAGLLLGLFAFILAGKNVHRHERTELIKVQDEQAFVQSATACLICDFQLAAGADLPPQVTTNTSTVSIKDFNAEPFSILPAPLSSFGSDRGPPASWIQC